MINQRINISKSRKMLKDRNRRANDWRRLGPQPSGDCYTIYAQKTMKTTENIEREREREDNIWQRKRDQKVNLYTKKEKKYCNKYYAIYKYGKAEGFF